ncbi:MAG TPA: carbonic anhydrase family protein [Planctomycetota bacterium]|nr:carbonic anhydrase family protein [Planctomycetota bacterium]
MLNRLMSALVFSGSLLIGCASPEREPSQARADVRVLTREAQTAMTPADALQRLKDGNERFATGRSLQRDSSGEIHASAAGQHPFAAVVSCLDSRTSAELVFDQGLGAVFSARLAGNVLNDDVLGSLEFATKVAGAKLIVVVGHSGCGAVKGACDKVELGHLSGLLKRIEPAVQATRDRVGADPGGKDPGFVNEVAREHVRRTVRQLQDESPILKDLVGRGSLKIVGAFHDLTTGRVVYLAESEAREVK